VKVGEKVGGLGFIVGDPFLAAVHPANSKAVKVSKLRILIFPPVIVVHGRGR
jgi:hypothetical protein